MDAVRMHLEPLGLAASETDVVELARLAALRITDTVSLLVPFGSVMGLTQHLAVGNIGGTALAPRRNMVGIHISLPGGFQVGITAGMEAVLRRNDGTSMFGEKFVEFFGAVITVPLLL